MSEKTHWLQSPNKNYLGRWDLPEGIDLVLTIKSAQWEEVKNPVNNSTESKRVITFEEDYKPLICNQTNAQSITIATGVKWMEDSTGQKIVLFVDNIKDKRTKEDTDCIRVRRINTEQILTALEALFNLKRSKLTDKEIERVEEVIINKEAEAYSKTSKHLNSK